MQTTKYKKILIIRSGAIGDIIQTTATFRSIKRAYPECEIDYVMGKNVAPLFTRDKELHKVYEIETRKYTELTKLGFTLRKNKYDLTINLQPSPRFRYLAFLTGAKKILTYRKDIKKHAVENYFATIESVFPELKCDSELHLYTDKNMVEKYRKMYNPDNKKVVIINTQATTARAGRKWILDSFLELSLALIEKYDCRIIVSGAYQDLYKVAYFNGYHDNITVIAGEHSLEESTAIFAGADLFISGDTGPLHIASALDKPVCVSLFGSTPISRCSPWGKKHFAIHSDNECLACFKRKCKLQKGEITPCMKGIKVETVLKVIEENKLL